MIIWKKDIHVDYYLGKIDKTVNAKLESKSDLRILATKAILSNRIAILQDYLKKRLDDSKTIDEALAYANVAMKVCKVAKIMEGA